MVNVKDDHCSFSYPKLQFFICLSISDILRDIGNDITNDFASFIKQIIIIMTQIRTEHQILTFKNTQILFILIQKQSFHDYCQHLIIHSAQDLYLNLIRFTIILVWLKYTGNVTELLQPKSPNMA